MFRVIKESEYVDERQHCFLLQTVGRESRYFSMETRQELLRLESAWHRAVCQAVSTLEVSQQCTQYTMCDFHDFGLTFFCFCTFENVKKCVLGGCTITSKAKINVF